MTMLTYARIIYCLTLISYTIDSAHTGIARDSVMESFIAGICKRGVDDETLLNRSYMECIVECQDRFECDAISYYAGLKSCRLHFDESLSTMHCQFYVYSEKSNWKRNTRPGCEFIECPINQKCVLTNRGPTCGIVGCVRIKSIGNGTVLGNDVTLGKKALFRCHHGFRLNGTMNLTCKDDGLWSGEPPVCDAAAARLGYPDYISVWSLITAQSEDRSLLVFDHGFDEVPGLVEVLVTPVDGPYKGFLFKATGTGSMDDDSKQMYSGVVYIYNEVNVTVIVPKRNNNGNAGYAMFTGDNSYWTGGSSYLSRDAYVKVRCWLSSNMPSPCYQSESIKVEVAENSDHPSFIEVYHGAGKQPDLVIVRTRLTGGATNGYYSDSQGTHRQVTSSQYQVYGGVISGFDNQSVRVWVPSTNSSNEHLFSTIDGWGFDGHSTTGVLDIRVWCDLQLTLYAHDTLNIGPDVVNEQTTLTFDIQGDPTSYMDVFASITVQADGGPNRGYYFNGIDGAISQTIEQVTPCRYGGLLYNYNTKTVNVRRPSDDLGALVCISDAYSEGMYTGAIRNGVVSVKLWKLEFPYGFSNKNKYTLYKNDSSIDYPDIGTIRTSSRSVCLYECTKRPLCVVVKYGTTNRLCTMFDSFLTSNVIEEVGSVIWYTV